jgi:ADP-ribose pyrophosphatase YjhB (NUDIX family)/quercetin dioxygenase-like cupin family protein
MRGKIEYIRSSAIDDSFIDSTRQYLVGDLKSPQSLQFILSKDLEVGITRYKQNQSEKGHYHSQATEYQLVLNGYTKYLDVDTNEEFEFKKGDFYIIRPFTKYLQKSKKETEILFFKFPSGNDKINIEETDNIINWFNSEIKTVRKDHYYSTNAPTPNSIRPAVAIALVNDGHILFIKRKDSGKWSLPGGTHEYGESLTETGIRELKEEVGYETEIESLVGTYTDPNILIEYSDGEVRQEFTFLYLGRIVRGQLQIDDESTEATWVPISKIYDLKMAKSQEQRVEDVLDYLKTGRQRLR